MYELSRETHLELPIDQVFSFFENPENLARITPPKLGFNILTPTPIEMKSGALIDYTMKVMGLPIHWTTLIAEYKPPYRFVDVQLKGPYQFWHHTHTFEETDRGTLMRDNVRYTLPFGPFGRIAHKLFVQKQLRQIFDHREVAIQSHLLTARVET